MDEKPKLKSEFKSQTKGYVLAGLGLVAGLAWNEAIKALIENVFTHCLSTKTLRAISSKS